MPDTVKMGVGVGLLLHLLQIPMFYNSSPRGLSLVFLGLTQFLYMLPAAIIAGVARRTRLLQGILIVSGITFLIWGAMCGALATYQLSRH
jgi:hypothetical protein